MTVTPSAPRNDIQVVLPNGLTFNGPKGTIVEEFILAAGPIKKGKPVAALIDGHLRELSRPIESDSRLVPITLADSDGVRIYRRSLSFLMIAAATEVFPNHVIRVDHSMPFGGYYCELSDHKGLTPDQLKSLKTRMLELVRENRPIERVRLPLAEALELFRRNNDSEKADLFARRRKDYLTLYQLNGVRDYFHGFMVPRTGYLDLFELHHYGEGFILQFPRRHQPDELQPFEDEPRLARVFQDYDDWLSVIDVPSVASLNRAMEEGRLQEIILVAEAQHQRQLSSIALGIAEQTPKVKLVLISGPSSAGKTTFSKRLAIQLIALGIQPVALAMDNYFVDRADTPRDADGELDFESLEALDMVLLQDHLRRLLAGEAVKTPEYNFHTGQRGEGSVLSLEPHQVILIEGIHGLNPRIRSGLDPASVFGVFVSAFTQLNLDQHNRVPTTDTRLLRRIVRDASKRGHDAAATIKRWPSVRRGEKFHIFPNQNSSDVFFNSALVYELSILKPLAQPLLLQVEPGTPERVEANRLLAFLQWFDPASESVIPSDSILREFIGGSILEHFEPWRR